MTELVTLRPGLTLEKLAAESWSRMEQAKGSQLDVNRSTVPRDVQMSMYKAWNAYANGAGPKPNHGRAIHPDYSWHCVPIARAVDTDDGVWIRNHPQYGWRFVVKDEKWHAQYYPELDTEKDDDMFTDEDRQRMINIDSNLNWLKERIGGSVVNADPSITQDIDWLKDAIGGTNKKESVRTILNTSNVPE